MSTESTKERIKGFFHRRGASNATSETGNEALTGHVRRRNSKRSMRDFVQRTGRSLSRNRNEPNNRSQHNRYSSSGVPPPVPTTYAVNDQGEWQRRPNASYEQPRSGSNQNEARPSTAPHGLKRTVRRISQDTTAEVGKRDMPIVASNLRGDQFSEEVADWNMIVNGHHYANHETSQDYQVSPLPSRSSSKRLSHKPDVPDLRRLSGGGAQQEVNGVPPRRSSLRQSAVFDTPPPQPPSEPTVQESPTRQPAQNGERPLQRNIVESSDRPIDLNKYVDLSNTEQTHVNAKWSPAVTHEVRQIHTHEIVQEAVTREIHNHHYYHRVLPVIDIEVLPARHFVPNEHGGYREISEAEIPAGSNTDRLQQLIREAVAKSMPKSEGPVRRRQFTARTFEGTEGDYREWTTADGQKHTERWWVHPPTLETGGQETGQTVPFHFESEDPRDDGVRTFQHETPPGLRSLRASQAEHRNYQKSPQFRNTPDFREKFVTPPQSPPSHTVLPIRMAYGALD